MALGPNLLGADSDWLLMDPELSPRGQPSSSAAQPPDIQAIHRTTLALHQSGWVGDKGWGQQSRLGKPQLCAWLLGPEQGEPRFAEP